MRNRGLLLLCATTALAWTGAAANAPEPETVPDRAATEFALEQHRDTILALPRVAGVGLARCGEAFCVKVLASQATDELREQLEQLLGTVPFVIETGDTPVPYVP